MLYTNAYLKGYFFALFSGPWNRVLKKQANIIIFYWSKRRKKGLTPTWCSSCILSMKKKTQYSYYNSVNEKKKSLLIKIGVKQKITRLASMKFINEACVKLNVCSISNHTLVNEIHEQRVQIFF